ncbi:MAG: DUF2079 domain-containing protein [Lachnospira sp.]
MAWCFVSLLQTIYAYSQGISVNNLELVGSISVFLSLTAIFGITAILYIVFAMVKDATKKDTDRLEGIILLTVTFVYSCVCAYSCEDVVFVLILTGILTLETIYCFNMLEISPIKLNLSKRAYVIMITVLMAVFTVFVGLCMAVRVKSYSAPDFDCGIFSQMFHYMKTTGLMNTTVERDRLMNHLAVHFSPIMYVILPFYYIIPSPVTLQVIQVVVIAMAAIPLSLIAKKKGFSGIQIIIICGIYLAGPIFSGGCFYDIHENMFFPLLIFTLLYFVENELPKQNIAIAVTMLLLWITKEDASIYVMCIALYVMLEKKKLNQGLIMFLSSFAYFIIVTVMLDLLGEGVITGGFNNMIYGGNGNLFGIIRTIIVNPAYIFTQMTDYSKILYLIQVLGSMAFLPLFTKKWSRFSLALPFIIFNLMPEYEYYHNIYFQFTLGSGSLLLFMAILNLADMGKKHLHLIIALECSVVMSAGFIAPLFENVVQYYGGKDREVYESIKEGLDTIPEDVSVKASPNFCVALSHYDELYDNMFSGCSTDYIAIDLRSEAEKLSAEKLFNNPQYEKIYFKEDVIVVFRCK